MNIYFNGNSSFLLETHKGRRILLDPMELIELKENINPNINLITISHNHKGESLNSYFNENTKILNTTTDFTNDFCSIKAITSFHDNHNGQKRGPNIIFKINCDGYYLCHLGHLGHKLNNDFCSIKAITSFHDNHNGQKRGPNIIFKINCDGYYLCHLGHLGHKLNNNIINSLKEIDVLFVPVGAYFTIGLEDLRDIIEEINPKYIIPMSYKTDKCSSYLKGLDSFLLKFKNYNYKKLDYLSLDKQPKYSTSLIIILDINKTKTLSSN